MKCEPADILLATRQKHRKQLQRADTLGRKGDDAGAEKIWRKFLAASPNDPIINFNLGVVVKQRANTPELRHEAGEFFAKVVECPEAELGHKADALNNLGILAEKAGYTDKALACYSFALKVDPNHAAALVNYGDSLRCLGEWEKAADCYHKVATAHPDSAEAHYSSGFIALLMGDYERGWREYRWRHKLQAWQTKPLETTRPMWNGEPLEGKTLLLSEEQGWGDSFMAIRFARPLSKLGARVVFGAQPGLREIMRGVKGLSDCVPRDDSTEFDYHLPLLDAPFMLGTTLATIPRANCLEILDSWPRWNPPEGSRKPRVALVWAGSPIHGRDRWRSITADRFQPIIDSHPELDFYSLQCGPRQPEVGLLHGLTDLAPSISSWTDTAQALKWIDLLVSVDTAVIHLAGCVDTAAFMLCPNSPDWRWLLGREDSPYYEKLRLFRQPKADDWQTPLDRINEALSKL